MERERWSMSRAGVAAADDDDDDGGAAGMPDVGHDGIDMRVAVAGDAVVDVLLGLLLRLILKADRLDDSRRATSANPFPTPPPPPPPPPPAAAGDADDTVVGTGFSDVRDNEKDDDDDDDVPGNLNAELSPVPFPTLIFLALLTYLVVDQLTSQQPLQEATVNRH
jgi:hypothetical protein